MSKYTRGLLAVILAVVLVLPAAAFAMLPEANARSSTGMDGPTVSGKIVDPDTTGRWQYWASGGEQDLTTRYVGRIWTDKTVEPAQDEKSDFVTTLSTMSSTSDTTSLVTKPLDIVMVLDASGSMDNDMGDSDSTKRIDALKAAASSFIDTIAEQNKSIKDTNKRHQVAIVKFSGAKKNEIGNDTYRDRQGYTHNYSQTMKSLTPCVDSAATELKNTVGYIEPAGATRADYGLELARDMSGREDAQKVVVFFTDGTPTDVRNFNPTVANNAIVAAKKMKRKGATVYTIGIFDDANPADEPTNYWTSDENKFMHAVSSNYPNAPRPTQPMSLVSAPRIPISTRLRRMPMSSRRCLMISRALSPRARALPLRSRMVTTRASPATSPSVMSWATLCRSIRLSALRLMASPLMK